MLKKYKGKRDVLKNYKGKRDVLKNYKGKRDVLKNYDANENPTLANSRAWRHEATEWLAAAWHSLQLTLRCQSDCHNNFIALIGLECPVELHTTNSLQKLEHYIPSLFPVSKKWNKLQRIRQERRTIASKLNVTPSKVSYFQKNCSSL